MYTPVPCRSCKAVLFYPDEVVIGTWNGEPNTRFDTLDFDDYESGVPEGYEAYCLDCAPCECEFHPPFLSDSDARDDGFCFVPACGEQGYHRHYPTPIGSSNECLCEFPSRKPCECEESCEKSMCDRCGEQA